jgi:transitional endoplasmic reticulum ATPase
MKKEELGDPEADVDMEEIPDMVSCITRAHFEDAFSHARRSVSVADLEKFKQFRKKQDPMYAAKEAGGGKAMINWPEDKNALPNADGEDDLYA